MKPQPIGSINGFIQSTFWVTTISGHRSYGNFNGTTRDLNEKLAKRKTPKGALVTTDIFGTNRYHWSGTEVILTPKDWQVRLVPAPGLNASQRKKLHKDMLLCETYSQRDAESISRIENSSREKSGNPYRTVVRKK